MKRIIKYIIAISISMGLLGGGILVEASSAFADTYSQCPGVYRLDDVNLIEFYGDSCCGSWSTNTTSLGVYDNGLITPNNSTQEFYVYHDLTTHNYVFESAYVDDFVRYDSIYDLQANQTNPDNADAQWGLTCGTKYGFPVFSISQSGYVASGDQDDLLGAYSPVRNDWYVGTDLDDTSIQLCG